MSTRLAFYTCFIGNSKNTAFAVPPLPSTKYDCYFFTNNSDIHQHLVNTPWKVIHVDIPISTSDAIAIDLQGATPVRIEYNTEDCMNSKRLRACPHTLDALRPYEYVCWLDTSLRVDDAKIEELLDQLDASKKTIVLSKHPYQFETVWGEYEEAMKHSRYTIQGPMYKAYIESKIAETGSDRLPVHYCGGFSVRKLQAPEVVQFNEEWYANILRCGIEDQISLQFVHQNYTAHVLTTEWKEYWRYSYE